MKLDRKNPTHVLKYTTSATRTVVTLFRWLALQCFSKFAMGIARKYARKFIAVARTTEP